MIKFTKDLFLAFIQISLLIWIVCEVHCIRDIMRTNMNKQNVIWLADAKECKNENDMQVDRS